MTKSKTLKAAAALSAESAEAKAKEAEEPVEILTDAYLEEEDGDGR